MKTRNIGLDGLCLQTSYSEIGIMFVRQISGILYLQKKMPKHNQFDGMKLEKIRLQSQAIRVA